MMVCKRLSDNFERGDDPESAQMISSDLNLPFGTTARVLDLMSDAHLLTEVESSGNRMNAYIPTRNLGKLKLSDLMHIINGDNVADLYEMVQGPFEIYVKHYEKLLEESSSLGSNMNISDLPWPTIEATST